MTEPDQIPAPAQDQVSVPGLRAGADQDLTDLIPTEPQSPPRLSGRGRDKPDRIRQAFAEGKAFIPFITGGDPDLATTRALILALAEAGANLIEIGIPFSDPVAEGPVIEAADERALAAGTTVDRLFDLVAELRSEGFRLPLVFMTYFNPIFAYGSERFLDRCQAAGLDGLIVPDLPFEEKWELAEPCRRRNLTLISMIAPTSEERIAQIATQADESGFLYCVSSLGVTGVRTTLGDAAQAMVAQVRQVSDIPCAVGFGISTPEQAATMAEVADGIIVGSAFVRLIAEHGSKAVGPVTELARQLVAAIR